MNAQQQPAWPKFKYLTNEVGGNLTKTRTMGLDASGKIHSLGYKTALIIETDTNNDVCSYIEMISMLQRRGPR